MTLRTTDVDAAVEKIRDWPQEDQEWWRALLERAPEEALIVAELALVLDARPTDTVLYS